MALEKDLQIEILREILKSVLKRMDVKFADAKRSIGNLAKEIEQKPEDIASILQSLYAEIVTEELDPEEFKGK